MLEGTPCPCPWCTHHCEVEMTSQCGALSQRVLYEWKTELQQEPEEKRKSAEGRRVRARFKVMEDDLKVVLRHLRKRVCLCVNMYVCFYVCLCAPVRKGVVLVLVLGPEVSVLFLLLSCLCSRGPLHCLHSRGLCPEVRVSLRVNSSDPYQGHPGSPVRAHEAHVPQGVCQGQ